MDAIYPFILFGVGAGGGAACVWWQLRRRIGSAVASEARVVAAFGPGTARVVMAEPRLLESLAVPETHPVYQAALAVIDQQMAEAILQSSNPEMVKTEGAALPVVHTVGGIEWMRAVREQLVELRSRAERAQREADAAERVEARKR